MKHFFRRFTATAAAAVTLLSASGITASAYDITSSNYQKLTYNYHGAGPGYCWGTTEQQNALPKLTTQFLSPRVYTTLQFERGQFSCTWMLCTLDERIISRDRLKDPALARIARQQLDKIYLQRRDGTPLGLKLEYEGHGKNNGLSSFGLRVMDDYNLDFYLFDKMYVKHDYEYLSYSDAYYLNDITGEYSGRICFDDLYIPGMRVTCSDPFTKFGEPVITWEHGDINVYVPFSGKVPSPDFPVFEGVYDKFMSREDFDLYFDSPRDYGFPNAYTGYVPGYHTEILTDLTVTYNYGNTIKKSYTTNDLALTLETPEVVSCD